MSKNVLNKLLVTCCLVSFVGLVSTFEECGDFEFECTDGTCIKDSSVCDGRQDCSDISDEENCDFKLCKAPDWYKCSDNETCISSEFLCDDFENCPDGDDEDHCERERKHEVCGKFEYTCDDRSCIPLDFMCDGRKDCKDGSDETVGCMHAEANCTGFFCKNKRCLESHTWVCDGVDDCGDGSDEVGCAWNCKPEENKFLCQDNDTCIALEKVCDGHFDCADKSDERGLCEDKVHICDSKRCPIESQCHVMPSGPTCVCPKGFRFDEDAHKCEDINECEIFGICSQGCENSVGSYKCTCADRFVLKSDGKTCEVKHGDPLMLYTTQKTVVGVYLKSRHVYKVAENLSKGNGVAYDGQNIFWANIQDANFSTKSASIVKARKDGSKQEVLLTSGLDAPQDLAVDWLTGNIYFSDNIMRHIAVCTRSGYFCTKLVTADVHDPEGIALHPEKGIMFWSDSGLVRTIYRASMDGSNPKAIVNTDIYWPHAVTLDIPNNRLYWVDLRLRAIESVKLDGSDRRMVLSDILEEPYDIAIFEDNIYWSDWSSKSIHTCHKFTGEHHEVVLGDDETILAVHIYHSALQPKVNNPCRASRCSHICLLAENGTSTCACPDGMTLSVDRSRCVRSVKKQRLYLGIKNYLIEIEHTSFGRHRISQGHPLPLFIHKMEYNSVNGTIFIADNMQQEIFEYDMAANEIRGVVRDNIGNVTALSFDPLAQNLYWADSERHTIEVLSLRNGERAILHFFSGMDEPIAMAVIPEIGKLFVTLQSSSHIHVDQLDMHGSDSNHQVFKGNFGRAGVEMLADHDTNTLYWLDTESGRIEFANIDKFSRHTFRSRLTRPAAMTIVDDDVFWSVRNSPIIYWTHKSNLGSIKKIEIETPKESYYSGVPERIPLLASQPITSPDHKCLHNNGGCSHICVSMGKYSSACVCPPSLVFKDHTNMTCIEALDCEFRCKSGECLTSSRRCNGQKDCLDGSDEKDCGDAKSKNVKFCAFDEFSCHDGSQCVSNEARCDKVLDCNDKSDEEDCEHFDHTKKCHAHQHSCDNGKCVDVSALCDGFDDCGDDSDEKHCPKSGDENETVQDPLVCGKDMFRCTSGTCIAKSWECDGKMDCIDGSDEHEKCAPQSCPTGYTKCRFGKCIDEKLICDGNDDCGDNSDEMHCDHPKRTIFCGDELDGFGDPKKFQCSSDPTMCLDIKAKCNGTAECPKGEDEVGCAGCSLYEFECKKSKECIRLDFRCDNERDCDDGSDEENCKVYNASSHHHFVSSCQPGMFDCQDGTCIDQTRTCDGLADCDNGQDETAMCETACKNHRCQHKCTPTPLGAACSCHEGYKLQSDKLTCVDINECEETNPCAQICENTRGSYRCSCFADFMLRADKTSCKSLDSKHHLLFSTFNQVRRLSDNPPALSVVLTANESRIAGLDVNVRKQRAYFTTLDGSRLYEYDLEKNEMMGSMIADSQSKVAVDWITGNVYTVSRAGVFFINMCNFQSKACASLIKFRSRDVVKAIAVDPVSKNLFYAVVQSNILGAPKTIIYVAGLDGSKREVLLTKVAFVTAMEAVPYKKELYFVDTHSKTLQSVSYRTRGVTKTIVRKDNAIKNPSGMTIYENIAYIVNIGSKEAVKCKLYGDAACEEFELNVYNAEDLVMMATSRQLMVHNACESNKCAGLCVQAELGPKCVCYDGKQVQEGVPCPKLETNEIGVFRAENSAHVVEDSNASTYIAATCFSILAVILIGGVGYIIYQRKRGRGKFNINMHFQNPLGGKTTSHVDHPGGEHFGRPIQRFFADARGTEIMLETKKEQTSLPSVGFNNRSAHISFTDSDDNDSTRDVGDFQDDPRARLVL